MFNATFGEDRKKKCACPVAGNVPVLFPEKQDCFDLKIVYERNINGHKVPKVSGFVHVLYRGSIV
jgi:hypothetical protein